VRVGITYNLKSDFTLPSGASLPEDASEEFDLPETIEAIRGVLGEEGHEVFLLGGDLGMIEKIEKNQVDFIFNIAEGSSGRSREAQIPAVLELLKIPYSGSDPLGMAVTLDKSLAKRVALSLGVPTPQFWIVDPSASAKDLPDRFPLFVKPLWEGSSKGIRYTSRVQNRSQLLHEIERLSEDYLDEPILVEEYIPGREMTVGILGNKEPEVLGIMEIAFRDPKKKDFCYSLEVKRRWRELVDYHFPARLEPSVDESIRKASVRLFQTLGLRDVARFDFRLNPEGEFFFLEANPLPGLAPDCGDFVLLAQKKGWSYRDLILKIMRSAMSRYPRLSKVQV